MFSNGNATLINDFSKRHPALPYACGNIGKYLDETIENRFPRSHGQNCATWTDSASSCERRNITHSIFRLWICGHSVLELRSLRRFATRLTCNRGKLRQTKSPQHHTRNKFGSLSRWRRAWRDPSSRPLCPSRSRTRRKVGRLSVSRFRRSTRCDN